MFITILKHLKLTSHEIAVLGILVGVCAIRLLLARENWPLLNSDEGTMGLMAMHIQHGELPIFFYGQHYMGALEAYIAAALFSLFGISTFALRLGLILIFMSFLITTYFLVRLLYSKNFALLIILLLSLGSNTVISRELSAIGGYMETLLFASLSFLIAAWMALSSGKGGRKSWVWRIVGYCAWGGIIGLGLWSDLLILPFALCSALLLFLFCWRELVKGAVIPLLLFLLLGAAPIIAYNLQASPVDNSWNTLMSQQGHEPFTLPVIDQQATNTLALSIPTITGSPFCHYSEYAWLDLLGFQKSQTPSSQCRTLETGWSLAYLCLFGLAGGLLIAALWKAGIPFRLHKWPDEEQNSLRMHTAQFLLWLSGFLTLVIFVRSSAPIQWPAIYSRYMIGLWIIVPVLLWPLWKSASAFWQSFTKTDRPLSSFVSAPSYFGATSLGLLSIILLIFLAGTVITLQEIPAANNAYQHEQTLIMALDKAGIRHVYSEYWTCNRFIFQSQEHIICATVGHHLEKIFTRDELYFTLVTHDPHSSYMFPPGYEDAITAAQIRLRQEKIPFRRFSIEEYTVLQPLIPGASKP